MSMTTPGTLIARGRATDVYALDADRVLRRYRDGGDAEGEAAVMEHARRHGFPVPQVFDASGADMVMQRVDGPTMLDDLSRRPWMLTRHARCLADLHTALHRIAAPPGLPAVLGGGDWLLHLDLHPANVLISAAGPVVIDWQAAHRGIAAVDVAQSWLLIATSSVPGNRRQRLVGRIGRAAFLRGFLAHVDADAAASVLPAVCAQRLCDCHLLPDESRAVQRFMDALSRRPASP